MDATKDPKNLEFLSKGLKERGLSSGKAWWWLSFADPELPKGQQFLGVSIVPGDNILDAATCARTIGCNPGGEVQGQIVENDEIAVLPEEYIGRLLSVAEVDILNGDGPKP